MTDFSPELKELAEATQEYQEAMQMETKSKLLKEKARKRLLLARSEYQDSYRELLNQV